MKDSQPAKKKTGVTRKLLSYLKGSKYIILAALVMAVIGAVLTIIGPNQIGKITDFMSAGLMSTIDMHGIARVGILLITIYVLSALFSYLQTYIMATVTLKSSKQMRKDISEKINKVPQGANVSFTPCWVANYRLIIISKVGFHYLWISGVIKMMTP